MLPEVIGLDNSEKIIYDDQRNNRITVGFADRQAIEVG
jgi:hypothetical protein